MNLNLHPALCFCVTSKALSPFLLGPDVGRMSQTDKAVLPLRHQHMYLTHPSTRSPRIGDMSAYIKIYGLTDLLSLDLCVGIDSTARRLAYVALPTCIKLRSLRLRRIAGHHELVNPGLSGAVVVDILSSLPASLQQLHLQVNMSKDGLFYIASQMEMLPHVCAIIKTLDPSAFCLGRDSFVYIQQMISLCSSLETLCVLGDADCNIILLLRSLKTNLGVLDIRSPGLGDVDAIFLGNYVHQNKNLRQLSVHLNTTITGPRTFFKVLLTRNRCTSCQSSVVRITT